MGGKIVDADARCSPELSAPSTGISGCSLCRAATPSSFSWTRAQRPRWGAQTMFHGVLASRWQLPCGRRWTVADITVLRTERIAPNRTVPAIHPSSVFAGPQRLCGATR
jgi:hypothetical protein